MGELNGKVAVITGSGCIGLGAALKFARESAAVHLGGNDAAHNQRVLKSPLVALLVALTVLAAPIPVMSQDAGAPKPKCTGMSEGAKCWLELADKPGCYVLEPYYSPPETATWSGACVDGFAVGQGVWKWRSSSTSGEATGTLVRGKRNGHWVERFADGRVAEGPYVEGEFHGPWILRYPDGVVAEGSYVEGEFHGLWILRYPDGSVEEGPFVDGWRHGQWVLRLADGLMAEGPYVEGELHGLWILLYPDGSVEEGPFVDGERHGRWIERNRDGVVEEGQYRHGERHGLWVLRYPDGNVLRVPFVSGTK